MFSELPQIADMIRSAGSSRAANSRTSINSIRLCRVPKACADDRRNRSIILTVAVRSPAYRCGLWRRALHPLSRHPAGCSYPRLRPAAEPHKRSLLRAQSRGPTLSIGSLVAKEVLAGRRVSTKFGTDPPAGPRDRARGRGGVDHRRERPERRQNGPRARSNTSAESAMWWPGKPIPLMKIHRPPAARQSRDDRA